MKTAGFVENSALIPLNSQAYFGDIDHDISITVPKIVVTSGSLFRKMFPYILLKQRFSLCKVKFVTFYAEADKYCLIEITFENLKHQN